MLSIRDLSFSYRRGKPLFRSLSLNLEPGNVYGLLGKNGAGKTTLLKLASGLLFPREGSCTLLGRPAEVRSPLSLREVFLLPEEFALPAVNAATYRRLYAPLYPRFDEQLFARCLREFQVEKDEPFTRLSYGQKKKALLAFAFATGCRLLLLDEPTNGLDIPSKGQFRRLLASVFDPRGSVVISTHQVRDMQNIIDPIVILDEGKIIFRHGLSQVAERLQMGVQREQPAPGDALYSEQVPGGYAVVAARASGQGDSPVDLELLFNAVTSNTEAVTSLFAGCEDQEA